MPLGDNQRIDKWLGNGPKFQRYFELHRTKQFKEARILRMQQEIKEGRGGWLNKPLTEEDIVEQRKEITRERRRLQSIRRQIEVMQQQAVRES